ncbi:flavodoxin family protein [Streptosporangium amethystogenes]|uniref:flavodoxin family protein n=1 Tax=Streptosporangium amethystogenes TaxID=2002 RepID=UPI0004C77A41|nr:flavodoxin domain-containing protein [Streptosporangium amethystogenes]
MRVVVVTESCFGNTSQVAEAIIEGLRSGGAAVEAVSADSAPPSLSADLVLVGAPTHNMGLPSSASRSQAAQKGGSAPSSGVREWIDRVDSVDGRVIAFSTTTGGLFAGSASKAIVKAFKRHKIRAEHGADFTVTGTPGPLAGGELTRAREWGRTLQV